MRLIPADNADQAAWAKEELVDIVEVYGLPANGLVPGCFPRFARVFHRTWSPPAEIQREIDRIQARMWTAEPEERQALHAEWMTHFGPDAPDHHASWTEIAERNRRVAHPLMQWQAINPPFSAAFNYEGGGAMSEEELQRLVEALGHATRTPDRCTFGFWEGWGGIDLSGSPTVEMFHVFHLYEGPLDALVVAADQLGEPPSMFWPEDRAWFVRNDIDSDFTVAGGSAEAIDRLLGQDGLEAMEVQATDRLDTSGDTLNELDPGNPHGRALREVMGEERWGRLPEWQANLLDNSAREWMVESLEAALRDGKGTWTPFPTPPGEEEVRVDISAPAPA